MGKEVSVDDRLAQIEQGETEIPDDVEDIEAFLMGSEAEEDEEAGKPAESPKPTEGEQPPTEAAPAAGKPEAEAAPTESAPAEEATSPVPVHVLRRTRESLHQAESLLSERDQAIAEKDARIAALEQQIATSRTAAADQQADLQAQADQVTGGGVKLEKLDQAALDALREDLDDSAVNFLEKLVSQNNALVDRVAELENASHAIEQREAHTDAQAFQDDIDSVPLLAALDATRTPESDVLWKRAVSYQKAVEADPDFENATRREVFTEVGRRLEAHLGEAEVAKWLPKDGAQPAGDKPAAVQQIVDDKLAAAREKAAPQSHSDLPAGSPAAATELERLDAMTIEDIEDGYLAAIERGQGDEYLARLMTAE